MFIDCCVGLLFGNCQYRYVVELCVIQFCDEVCGVWFGCCYVYVQFICEFGVCGSYEGSYFFMLYLYEFDFVVGVLQGFEYVVDVVFGVVKDVLYFLVIQVGDEEIVDGGLYGVGLVLSGGVLVGGFGEQGFFVCGYGFLQWCQVDVLMDEFGKEFGFFFFYVV